MTSHQPERSYPDVVIGAGPVGLAAATRLLARGHRVVVLDAGDRAGAHVRAWGHVHLFSPWGQVVDPAAVELLDGQGWVSPDPETFPTGWEWAEQYLQPLADALVSGGVEVRYGTRVTGVARRGRDVVVDAGRDTEPLTVHVHGPDGEDRLAAASVLDASGTWATPNPLGSDGLPALGEVAAADQISYAVPDLTDPAVRARYAGRHVVVAGTGASAHTTLVGLGGLAEDEPGTRITWLVRRAGVGDAFGGGEADELPQRGALGARAHDVVTGPYASTATGFRTTEVHRTPEARLQVVSEDGQVVEDVDEVVALTGQRPDLSFLTEVRLDLDPALQSPTKLAPLVDPNVHSCGTVYPHGAAELTQPEPGLFLLGAKAYGRAPTFLALTGYEQARSVAAALDGDTEDAGRVELTLPETGVCGGAGLYEDPASPRSSPAMAQVGAGGSCCS